MKKTLIVLMLLTAVISLQAQNTQTQSRREQREEKQAKQKEKISSLLAAKNFSFVPTHALPMGGSSVQLNYTFEVTLKNDTVESYMPYFGVAYHAEYGGRNSPFDFTLPLLNYRSEKENDGYSVVLEVRNKMDNIKYSFHISELGYATLNITSTNRQPISYYGNIIEPEEP